MSGRRRIWPIVRRLWVTFGVTATVVFVTWSAIAYRASPEARRAAVGDSVVSVDHADGVWRFEPLATPPKAPTLVFFPGGLVDPRAYAPLARAVARAGHRAVIVELPRRGAFGGADSPELASRIRGVLAAEGGDHAVVVGGHSRGGVVATRVVAGHRGRVAGLVLVGTSHPRDHDLGSATLPITKIAGTRDGLATPERVRSNAGLLPAHTRWIWIDGGNHSQFGWYGFQPGDRRPRIDAARQRDAMIAGVLALLREVDRRSAGTAGEASARPAAECALATVLGTPRWWTRGGRPA